MKRSLYTITVVVLLLSSCAQFGTDHKTDLAIDTYVPSRDALGLADVGVGADDGGDGRLAGRLVGVLGLVEAVDRGHERRGLLLRGAALRTS